MFNGATSAELIAIKAGDVNNSYSLQGNSVGPRKAKTLLVTSTEETNEIEVQFEAGELVAAQYKIGSKGGEHILSVDGLPETTYVISDDRTFLTVALAGEDLQEPFTLRFDDAVEEVLLDPSYTAEAYDVSGANFSLSLKQASSILENESVLSFSPTVLKDISVIRSTGEKSLVGATILISDALGRVVLNQIIGAESFELKLSDLPTGQSGALMYSISNSQEAIASGVLLLSK